MTSNTKHLTLSLWMVGHKSKIEKHERSINEAYERLKELNNEMANLFVSIDNHTKEIEFQEFSIAEIKKQKEALKTSAPN